MMENDLFLPEKYKFGVVEGFFGIPWSWEARADYAHFLANTGFNTYLYAPKADQYLRKEWQAPFPEKHHDNLIQLSELYRKHKLAFGIGLSPFEIYRNFDTSSRRLLRSKLVSINDINPDVICLLFDDMPGELTDLAEQQCEVMTYIIENTNANNYIFCPTYYSNDPVLARQFGAPPENYLETLGNLLPKNVDIFWTGPKVVSTDYPEPHLKEISRLIKRKPVLWDNYPVNDSKLMCDFLHLSPPGYDSEPIAENCSGHLCNPMNQAYLSQIPLKALAMKYSGNTNLGLLEKSCSDLLPEALKNLIITYLSEFEVQGLENISTERLAALKLAFNSLEKHPASDEISRWLDGYYQFDPSCLT